MDRRNFLKIVGMGGFALSVTTGCTGADNAVSDLGTMINKLLAYKSQALQFEGPWQAYATFTHLAQSVEYSYLGYPQHKSDGFKTWVGKPAFTVFKTVGVMHHNTAEPIPGAPELYHADSDSQHIDMAIDRLIAALQDFQNSRSLQPHFAYGQLTPDDYLIAHLLHIEDHLDLLRNV